MRLEKKNLLGKNPLKLGRTQSNLARLDEKYGKPGKKTVKLKIDLLEWATGCFGFDFHTIAAPAGATST